MFNSTILDVAVGLIFVYRLMRLMVTAAIEMISSWLKWRSNNLWNGLHNLLQSEKHARDLLDHPLIESFYFSVASRKPRDILNTIYLWHDIKRPSYIAIC
jgi:hypothetical protein